MVVLCTHDDVGVTVLMVVGGGTGLMLVKLTCIKFDHEMVCHLARFVVGMLQCSSLFRPGSVLHVHSWCLQRGRREGYRSLLTFE